MKDEPENELFSAYLDGELTADEQAEMEQLLATSPAARQLVEELRALRSTLQALPPHRIGEDITQQVLRRAERRMLSEPAQPERRQLAEPLQPLWRAILGRVLQPRALVWSGLAASVAILLLVMESERLRPGRDRPVAMKSPAAEDASGVAPSMRARFEEAEGGLAAEAAPAEMPDVEAAPAEPEGVIAKAGMPKAAPARGLDAPATPAPARTEKGGTLPMPSSMAPESGRRDFASGYGRTRGAHAEQPAAAVASKRGRLEEARFGAAQETGAPDSAEGRGLAANALAERLRAGEQRAGAILLVRCNVTDEAARRRTFERLLDERRIALAEIAKEAETRREAVGKDFRANALGVYNLAAQAPREMQFEVEATPDQIAALYADLQTRPDEFSALSYAYLPGPPVMPFAFGVGGPARATRRGLGEAEAAQESAVEPRKEMPRFRREKGQLGSDLSSLGRRAELETQLEGEQAAQQQDRGLRRRDAAGQPSEQPADAKADRARRGGAKLQKLMERLPATETRAAEPPPAEKPAEAWEEEAEAKQSKPLEQARDDSDAEVPRAEAMPEKAGQAEAPLAKPRPLDEKAPRADSDKLEQLLPEPPPERPAEPAPIFRVRFVLHVVGPQRPDVAASVAEEAAKADVAAEAGARTLQMPAAKPLEAAEPAGVEP